MSAGTKGKKTKNCTLLSTKAAFFMNFKECNEHSRIVKWHTSQTQCQVDLDKRLVDENNSVVTSFVQKPVLNIKPCDIKRRFLNCSSGTPIHSFEFWIYSLSALVFCHCFRTRTIEIRKTTRKFLLLYNVQSFCCVYTVIQTKKKMKYPK